MHHALAWQHSYIVERGSNSQVCPLGKVHKDGHAILCALTIALAEDEKDVYDSTDSYILQCKTLNLGKSIGTTSNYYA